MEIKIELEANLYVLESIIKSKWKNENVNKCLRRTILEMQKALSIMIEEEFVDIPVEFPSAVR